MPNVGIRELKNDTSEIIRTVREQQTEYIVTYRGEPVALILPLGEDAKTEAQSRLIETSRPDDEFWARWDAHAEELEAVWPSDVSAVEAVDEQRRDL